MGLADEIREKGREAVTAPSGISYVIRAVWPVDLHRDGVLPVGTLSQGRAPTTLDDEQCAKLEVSLLRRGVCNVKLFDGDVPEGSDGVSIQDMLPSDRNFLVSEISKRSGLIVSTVDATGGSGF